MDYTPNIRAKIDAITKKIQELQNELEIEMAKRRAELRFGIEQGKIRFEQEILRRHKELKVSLLRYIVHARPLIALSAFIIYPLIIPLVLLDIFVTIYQAICFPIYGIEKVHRKDYLIFDRYHLAYLNILQKVNCAYCSYANGVIGYVREIGGRTEQYWCPIKHAKRLINAHGQYLHFADYGDAEEYERISTKPFKKPFAS